MNLGGGVIAGGLVSFFAAGVSESVLFVVESVPFVATVSSVFFEAESSAADSVLLLFSEDPSSAVGGVSDNCSWPFSSSFSPSSGLSLVPPEKIEPIVSTMTKSI